MPPVVVVPVVPVVVPVVVVVEPAPVVGVVVVPVPVVVPVVVPAVVVPVVESVTVVPVGFGPVSVVDFSSSGQAVSRASPIRRTRWRIEFLAAVAVVD